MSRAIPAVVIGFVAKYPHPETGDPVEVPCETMDEAELVARLFEGAAEAVTVPCSSCEDGSPVPHNGSRYCESGSIASGGNKAHCTCDVCF